MAFITCVRVSKSSHTRCNLPSITSYAVFAWRSRPHSTVGRQARKWAQQGQSFWLTGPKSACFQPFGGQAVLALTLWCFGTFTVGFIWLSVWDLYSQQIQWDRSAKRCACPAGPLMPKELPSDEGPQASSGQGACCAGGRGACGGPSGQPQWEAGPFDTREQLVLPPVFAHSVVHQDDPKGEDAAAPSWLSVCHRHIVSAASIRRAALRGVGPGSILIGYKIWGLLWFTWVPEGNSRLRL